MEFTLVQTLVQIAISSWISSFFFYKYPFRKLPGSFIWGTRMGPTSQPATENSLSCRFEFENTCDVTEMCTLGWMLGCSCPSRFHDDQWFYRFTIFTPPISNICPTIIQAFALPFVYWHLQRFVWLTMVGEWIRCMEAQEFLLQSQLNAHSAWKRCRAGKGALLIEKSTFCYVCRAAEGTLFFGIEPSLFSLFFPWSSFSPFFFHPLFSSPPQNTNHAPCDATFLLNSILIRSIFPFIFSYTANKFPSSTPPIIFKKSAASTPWTHCFHAVFLLLVRHGFDS